MSALIYEVQLHVDVDIAQAYRAWLQTHVQDMLAVPGFVSAQLFEVLEPAPAQDQVVLCVHYRVHGMAALQDYFEHRAPRMRAEGIERFGDGFRASRRVLQAID